MLRMYLCLMLRMYLCLTCIVIIHYRLVIKCRYARDSLTKKNIEAYKRTLLRRSRVNVRQRRGFAKNYAVASVLVVRTTVHNINRSRYDTGFNIITRVL